MIEIWETRKLRLSFVWTLFCPQLQVVESFLKRLLTFKIDSDVLILLPQGGFPKQHILGERRTKDWCLILVSIETH